MTGKDNKNKNKGNSNKKSNVIYIDRNKKTGQISTKNTTKNNKNTTKEKNNVEKNKPVKPKQNTSVKNLMLIVVRNQKKLKNLKHQIILLRRRGERLNGKELQSQFFWLWH